MTEEVDLDVLETLLVAAKTEVPGDALGRVQAAEFVQDGWMPANAEYMAELVTHGEALIQRVRQAEVHDAGTTEELRLADEQYRLAAAHWQAHVEKLERARAAGRKFNQAFLLKAATDRRCMFCGDLKRGYIHQEPCAFVDFANDAALVELELLDWKEKP